MRCTSCDHLNPADARFCTSCGSTFTTTATVPLQVQPAAPVPAPLSTTMAASAPVAAAAPLPALNQTINVTVQAPAAAPAAAPVIVLAQQAAGPGCIVRALYFCCIGLWLGFFWTGAAWFLLVTVIGLPLGILMLNRIPQVMTLKPVRTQTQVTTVGGVVMVSQGKVSQQTFWLRALYFIAIGWWLSGLWLGAAWGLVGITFGLGLPLAFWMIDRTPAIVTLARQ